MTGPSEEIVLQGSVSVKFEPAPTKFTIPLGPFPVQLPEPGAISLELAIGDGDYELAGTWHVVQSAA